MEVNIILAGVGGQGILTIAQAIAAFALRRGWQVKQAEVHGMAQRGGAVYSHLRVADHELFSDLIPAGQCDCIVSLEPLEALRYVQYLRPDGCVISSTVTVTNVPEYPPLDDLLERISQRPNHVLLDAEKLGRLAGSPLSGNCVLLGALCDRLDFPAEELDGIIGEMFQRKGPRIVDVNRKAFRIGRRAAGAYLELLARGARPREARDLVAGLRLEELESLETPNGEWSSRPQDSSPGQDEVAALLRSVAAAGRSALFEHEVYRIVQSIGAISPPKHCFVPIGCMVDQQTLEQFDGERVVLKIVSPKIVHKSDAGGVIFVPRRLADVNERMKQLCDGSAANGSCAGVLLVECVPHDDAGFGKELFVGIRTSREFGPVIAAGVGGIDTEYLAQRMKPGQAIAKALALKVSAEEFLEIFKTTAAYDVLAGRARGHRRVVSDGELLRCFRGFLQLARRFFVSSDVHGPRLVELEVNPFAFVRQRMVPLDGRGRIGEPPKAAPARPVEKVDKLLEPATIAVVGVSGKKVNFARHILRNVLSCGFPLESVCAIHPELPAIDGVKCYPRIGDVPGPIDLLAIATAAESVPLIIEEAVNKGDVASVVLIPGGLGETEGSHELQERLRGFVHESRRRKDRGPVILGGNCLGIRSHPGRYDTFFVPSEKLDPRHGRPTHPLALITQSGAFAITRMSNLESIVPLVAATIGNQLDLTVSDLVRSIGARSDVAVLGVYVEGFNDLDGIAFVDAVRDATAAGKTVVFYKAGRTAPGRSATAGHTASLAGDYDVCQAVAAQAGALVVDTFKEFEQVVELATLFHDRPVRGRRIGAISNAGVEAVAMADTIQGPRYQVEMAILGESTRQRLEQRIRSAGLGGLVSVHNPLDVNPMANESVYEEAILAMLDDANVDAVVASIVPFTPHLRTAPDELDDRRGLVYRLPEIVRSATKPVAVVVDAGPPYDVFARRLRAAGVPVFPCCDQAIRSLGRYLHHRSRAAGSAFMPGLAGTRPMASLTTARGALLPPAPYSVMTQGTCSAAPPARTQ